MRKSVQKVRQSDQKVRKSDQKMVQNRDTTIYSREKYNEETVQWRVRENCTLKD